MIMERVFVHKESKGKICIFSISDSAGVKVKSVVQSRQSSDISSTGVHDLFGSTLNIQYERFGYDSVPYIKSDLESMLLNITDYSSAAVKITEEMQ